MWFEIFKFEIQYRAKRLETYLFFAVVFLFSIIAFNFVFEGQNLGLVKENSPYVIAKVMSIVSCFFMLIVSMVMGMPILRDFQHNIESLLYVTPIKKRDYLIGRFLGSFVILVFIFSGLIWGMIMGELMPWRAADKLLSFSFLNYLYPFYTIVLPTLFFSSSMFFVSGTLSRKLIVVYTQGLIFFIIYIISIAIENPIISALLDPFAFHALDTVVEFWDAPKQNSSLIPIQGLLFYNRIIWILMGIIVLIKGYHSFNFNVLKEGKKKQLISEEVTRKKVITNPIIIPNINVQENWTSTFIQLKSHSLFYFKSITKEASFWAIVICGIVTIVINSINLGTSYRVDSYPTSYLIVEEFQEMSIFFFLIILIFYSGELIWKERDIKFDLIYDALPLSDFVNLASKFIGLILIYILLLSILMLSGIGFQASQGYFHFDLKVYFIGLFLQILPFFTLFTFITFFFQAITNSKFIGYIGAFVFFILTMGIAISGLGHSLFKFGGIGLEDYSDMNAYGHFLAPFLWYKLYWFAFSILLFVISVIINTRGEETALKTRWKLKKQRLNKYLLQLSIAAISIFILTGTYIFYNTNILNTYYSILEKEVYRVAYETTLKRYEYLTQPKITAVNLKVDLFPCDRNYVAEGYYILENKSKFPIKEIHIQKYISDQEYLSNLQFEGGADLNNEHERFGYFIYKLHHPLASGDSIRMDFKQEKITRGFSDNDDDFQIIQNGTFFNNDRFPTIGYNKKYELQNEQDRKNYNLAPRKNKAKRDDQNELQNGRSGDDGSKIDFEIILSTNENQIVIAPGQLQQKWTTNNRNYFHYKMNQPMINFYSIVSADYEVLKDKWAVPNDSLEEVDLEIYYHKGHEYNLHRMMQSMKASLSYYSENFSPYQYEQMRIMEFPRYRSFAQSFPNTIPYSESMGFIMDIEDEKDLDMPFFITAHEVAHQWWGMQLVAANVQGKHFILETLAQYSALMVFKENYSTEQVQRLLEFELDRYEKGRKLDTEPEIPLELVENQEYIYYSKGINNMYLFQECIEEDKVNLALSRFIKDWNCVNGALQTDRYPTSADLLTYFKEVTPDSLQYIVSDLFETASTFEH